jgi:eukaryotic-like serine/threonine-protein kinase
MESPTQRVSVVPVAGLPNGPVSPGQDLTGKTLGDFCILRRLGEGGMGQVYLSEQLSLKRPVALKILKADLAANPNSLKRFKAEGEAVARATHANIVQVHAIGELDGLHYMALEYVDGLNLRDYLAKKGPPPLPLAVSIMRQVAAALQCAGELGIIHRDIKPDNILLTRKGVVKIADFGLSRCLYGDQKPVNLTQSGVTMGTPLYMSPEQVEGKPLDPRTDIYSFGVTCYHMLAGHSPYHGETAFEVALQHVQGQAEPLDRIRPDLPAELCAIVQKMMAKSPDHRYQTGRDLFRDLTRLRDSISGSVSLSGLQAAAPLTPTPGPTSTVKVGVLTPWRLAGVALGSVVVALLVSVALGWRAGHAHTPRAAPAPESAVTDNGSDDLAFQKHREQMLVAAAKRITNVRGGALPKGALRTCMDLGLLYLDEWRLDDADRFFNELIDIDPQQKYRGLATFGRLGHAIVLAFRDQAVESTTLFQELLGEKNQGLGRLPWALNRNPPLFLRMLVKALDYNAANYQAAGRPFPPELEAVRKAEPLPVKNPPPRPGQAPANKA